jgi:pantoate--beta-alanine ligase
LIAVKDLSELRAHVRDARASGKSIGLVPTMGALHAGHLSLVRLARRESSFVVVSIFVNPLQFAPGEDFERYPRRAHEDSEMLDREGADLVYLPDAAQFYSRDFSTAIEVAGVSDGGEGAVRPGHFRGVATVVGKLFLQVAPDAAVFGRKDLQQVAVIRQMTRDLDFPVRLVIGETVREPDGLALSSRNIYLSPSERQRAALFPKVLFDARDRVRAGERDPQEIERAARQALADAGFSIDYVDVLETESMRRPTRIDSDTALAAAIRVGKTRLIDNVVLLER